MVYITQNIRTFSVANMIRRSDGHFCRPPWSHPGVFDGALLHAVQRCAAHVQTLPGGKNTIFP